MLSDGSGEEVPEGISEELLFCSGLLSEGSVPADESCGELVSTPEGGVFVSVIRTAPSVEAVVLNGETTVLEAVGTVPEPEDDPAEMLSSADEATVPEDDADGTLAEAVWDTDDGILGIVWELYAEAADDVCAEEAEVCALVVVVVALVALVIELTGTILSDFISLVYGLNSSFISSNTLLAVGIQ